MPSRAKGLWWKEWRQLRLLRIVGASLILFGPLMLLSAAEGARRGWVPLGGLQNYSAATVVQDALPLFLGFLIWPLLALMFVAQGFCGDIASGTEWFWMARPVQPRRVWTTRLLASLASLAGVMALHWVVWRLLVNVWGNPDAFDAVGQHTRWFLMNQFQVTAAGAALTAGLLIAVAAFLSALAASAFARSPMQALPLGLIFLALPLGLGQLLAALFPYALLDFVNPVAGIPLLLFPAYALLSYRSSCRGEPAGRGKLVRGLTALGVGLVSVVAVALPTGFWLTKDVELRGLVYSVVVASPAGDRFFVFNDRQGSGWLFDAETGDELLHLRPLVVGAAWNAEGDRLAVSRFGAYADTVIDIYDRDGLLLVDGRRCETCFDIAWAGDQLMVSTRRDGSWWGDWFDPATGERRPGEFGSSVVPLALVGPDRNGVLYVARQTEVAGKPDADIDSPYRGPLALVLHPMDRNRVRIDEPILIEGVDRYYRLGDLAPDGSAVLSTGMRDSAVIDLTHGRGKQIGTQPAWLHPNQAVWTRRDAEELVILVDEDDDVRELKRFDGHGAVALSGAPDGRRLLLVRYPNVSRPGGVKKLQHWIYDRETDRWTELEQTQVDDRYGWPAKVEWVNDDTVVLRGIGMLALCKPGVPDSLRVIKGG